MNGYPRAITERQVGRPGEGWVGPHAPADEAIRVVDPDPEWAGRFAAERERVRAALRGRAHRIEHVGSTSVPGLPAKPIIDIDLWLDDTDDEDGYVPVLTGIGYTLVLREPWWNGHRMLVSAGEPAVNLHAFPATAPEPLRHLLFRDWLRSHADDRDLYASTKRELADSTRERPADYNMAKNAVIDDIYERIFSVPPGDHPAWPSELE